jgi:NifB/MoaA-like Fe-S oxidoreductase
MGDPILSVSVVPVGLTEFSKHTLVRESSSDESRNAVETVSRFQIRSLDERGEPWVFGSDELYIRAQLPLPEYDAYGNFEQVENGVGSVRFVQGIIDDAASNLPNLEGQQIAVVTGVAMGHLMPLITSRLEEHTGGSFDVIVVENDLFGPRVTTAGLLPGESMLRALEHRRDIDMALLPAESLNDDRRFIDDVPLETIVAAVSADVRCSYDFTDVLLREAN